jgi:hypothetical protein
MQKTTPSSKKTDLANLNSKLETSNIFQPKTETLKKILQFASSYKAEKIADNQYIELILN